jgi:hypothetical protein
VETLDENAIRFLIVSFCYLDASNAPLCSATGSTFKGTTLTGADRYRLGPLRALECEEARVGLDSREITP